jgi:hypothetical protein
MRETTSSQLRRRFSTQVVFWPKWQLRGFRYVSSSDHAQRAFILFLFDSDAASIFIISLSRRRDVVKKFELEVQHAETAPREAWHAEQKQNEKNFKSLLMISPIYLRVSCGGIIDNFLCCLDRLFYDMSKCQWYHRSMNCTSISSAVALLTTAYFWSSSLSLLRICVGSDKYFLMDTT